MRTALRNFGQGCRSSQKFGLGSERLIWRRRAHCFDHHPQQASRHQAISGALPGQLYHQSSSRHHRRGHGRESSRGGFLSLGHADLKGSLGISYDDGAWIGSAFNIALMFIGPFAVYLRVDC